MEFSKNILIAYNPNSGKGRGLYHARQLEKALLKRGANVGLVLGTPSVQSVYDFCRDRGREFTLLVIIGGDGTLSHWVDAAIKSGLDIPIYAFGRGTANDFSTYFKTNKSPRKVAKIIMTRSKVREVDVLEVGEDTYAINVACGGAFTNGVTTYSKLGKRIFGKLAYIWGSMKVIATMRAQEMLFNVDGVEIPTNVYFFLILNTTNAGSIKKISPLALPNDGYLNLVAMKKSGLFKRLGVGLSIVFGRAHKNKNMLHAKGKQITATIVGEPNLNFTLADIDGNVGGEYPVRTNVSSKKAKIVVPYLKCQQ